MTNTEIKELADRVLGPHLDGHGLERIEVRVDDDPSDPALFVEAFMKPGVTALGKGVASNAHHALSQSLLDSGEPRFPYFLVRFRDDPPLDDAVADAG